ncbi:hypothetical protein AB0I28_33745 [Phytomonospora sp. NPDC050363]|uniref:hypothetical protein n=1 Tax=Phytomonospora sp. NPDC050363 TaxID=3155642 RepID=UPI00340E2EBC
MIGSVQRVIWGPPRPEWALSRHPESPARVETTPVAPASVPAGHGVLDLRVGGVFSGGFGTGAPRPQPPVVLIGSRPVTQGWGRAWIVLPAGEHVLEVQAGRSRLTQVVSVAAGASAELDYLHCAPWRHDPEEKETALGPRGAVRLAPKIRQNHVWAGLAVFALAAYAASFMIGRAADMAGGAGTALRLSGWALVVVAPLAVFTVGFVRAAGTRRALRAAPTPALAPGLVLLPAEGEVPAPPAGMGGVVVEAVFAVSPNSRDRLGELLADGAQGARRRELTENLLRIGEPLPLPHRPWVGPVRFAVDGRELALPWGRWLVPLAPGTHELAFATPPPSPALTDHATVVDLADSQVRRTVTVTAGQVEQAGYTVVMTMQSQGERPALRRFAAMAVDRAPQPM